MSLEKALREMVRAELALQLSPLRKAVGDMEEGLEALQVLRAVSGRLEPLAQQFGLGPPRRARTPVARQEAPARGRPVRTAPGKKAEGERACAVKGCRRPARSKGYCSAHYQKLRLLIKTDRRPADWKDDAPPQSAQDVKLPRGRAAAQALASAAPPAPAEPPKPKAWLRKKGKPGMVSLN